MLLDDITSHTDLRAVMMSAGAAAQAGLCWRSGRTSSTYSAHSALRHLRSLRQAARFLPLHAGLANSVDRCIACDICDGMPCEGQLKG